jgi:cyclopropane fatty-acyl-phospholipid synthase-like methyltransferase
MFPAWNAQAMTKYNSANPATRCIVCGGLLRPSRIAGLLECEGCRFTTADLCIPEEDLRQLYTAPYFAGEEYRDYLGDRSVIEKQSRLRLRRLLKHVQHPERKHMFEIGCAYGFFLSVARKTFLSVEGVDVSTEATEYASRVLGLNAHGEDFLKYQFSSLPEVICMWDTIEHLCRPDLYIERAAGVLPRGGFLALTTSDLDSLVARIRGSKWRQIHPPTHLHYFSRATLQRLLRRYGFQVKEISTEGIYRSLDTMAYIVLCLKWKQPALYARLRKTGFLNWDLFLDLRDIVFVVAEKR